MAAIHPERDAEKEWGRLLVEKRILSFWRSLGYTAARIFRELTFAEYVEGFLFNNYEQWTIAMRQQYAVSAGIGTALFGKPGVSLETLFGLSDSYGGQDSEKKAAGLIPLHHFPYDITPLPRESVLKLMEFSRERKLDLWNDERGKAAINTDDRLLSRVAQDDYLWKKWQYAMSSGRPSQETVYRWAENALHEKMLSPSGYFIDKCLRDGKDPQTEWDRLLGPSRGVIQESLFSGMLNG